MIAEVLRSRAVHTDDTTVQRQDPETGQWSTARFWNYVGDEAYPLTVFQYTLTHERTHPATFLRDYQGYLQADAYNGYDGIYLESGGKIIEVGCWQHARKRFKAAQASDLRAQVAMAFIKSMYAIEKRIRQRKTREWADLSIDECAERVLGKLCQAETVPLLNNFGVWLRQTSGNVLPKSELGEAIRYTLNQWDCAAGVHDLWPAGRRQQRGRTGPPRHRDRPQELAHGGQRSRRRGSRDPFQLHRFLPDEQRRAVHVSGRCLAPTAPHAPRAARRPAAPPLEALHGPIRLSG